MSLKNENTPKGDEPIKNVAETEYVDEPFTSEVQKTKIEKSRESKDRPAIIANLISVIGLIVNIVLAGFTYMLFQKTVEANKTSSASLSEARNAVKAAENANAISQLNYELAAQSSLSSDATSKANFQLAKRALDAQILYSKRADSNYLKSINVATDALDVSKSNLERTQKFFEIENKAYLLLSNVKMDSFIVDKRQQITINVKNYGKLPVLIEYSLTGFLFDTAANIKKLQYPPENIKYHNFYLPAGSDIALPYASFIVEPLMYQALTKQVIFAFVYGEVIYVDVAANKRYSYTFCLRLHTNGRFAPTPLNNRTYEVKDVSPVKDAKKG